MTSVEHPALTVQSLPPTLDGFCREWTPGDGVPEREGTRVWVHTADHAHEGFRRVAWHPGTGYYPAGPVTDAAGNVLDADPA